MGELDSAERFQQWVRSGGEAPQAQAGTYRSRLQFLRCAALDDSSLARLIEAHADATSICAEAGQTFAPGIASAVWASGPTSDVVLQADGDHLVVSGTRRFCGGAPKVETAIITTAGPQGEQLVRVRLDSPGVTIDPTPWQSPAFAAVQVSTVHFDRVRVALDGLVGPAGWYGNRRGFWLGSIGVAALWVGMAERLVDGLPSVQRRTDQCSDAARGRAVGAMWSAAALLDYAGMVIDSSPAMDTAEARNLALAFRHGVRTHVVDVLAAFDSEAGPAPAAHGTAPGVLRAEIGLALAQDHGDRALADLGAGSGLTSVAALPTPGDRARHSG